MSDFVFSRKAVIDVIDHEETGLRHRRFRIQNNLTLKEVSERSGYSLSFIGMLEIGNRVWTEHISERIVSAINSLVEERESRERSEETSDGDSAVQDFHQQG